MRYVFVWLQDAINRGAFGDYLDVFVVRALQAMARRFACACTGAKSLQLLSGLAIIFAVFRCAPCTFHLQLRSLPLLQDNMSIPLQTVQLTSTPTDVPLSLQPLSNLTHLFKIVKCGTSGISELCASVCISSCCSK